VSLAPKLTVTELQRQPHRRHDSQAPHRPDTFCHRTMRCRGPSDLGETLAPCACLLHAPLIVAVRPGGGRWQPLPRPLGTSFDGCVGGSPTGGRRCVSAASARSSSSPLVSWRRHPPDRGPVINDCWADGQITSLRRIEVRLAARCRRCRCTARRPAVRDAGCGGPSPPPTPRRCGDLTTVPGAIPSNCVDAGPPAERRLRVPAPDAPSTRSRGVPCDGSR
jgi:hypothetical protein